MPPRRSTRGRTKKGEDSLSSIPSDRHEDPNSLCSTKKHDEVDGPAPATVDKKTSQRTRKRCSKKIVDTEQQKVLCDGSGKDGCAQKEIEHDDMANNKKRKSGVAGAITKGLPNEGICHVRETESSQLNQNSHPSTERSNTGKLAASHDDSLPDSLGKKANKKETVHQKDMRSKLSADDRGEKPVVNSPNLAAQADKNGQSKCAMATTSRKVNSSRITTEDSTSSDSDFEEVSSQYRTPESSIRSSMYFDSGICRKLEDSFSDYTTSSQDLSLSISGNDHSSSFSSAQDMDSGATALSRDSSVASVKRNTKDIVSGKAAKKAETTVSATEKMTSAKNKPSVKKESKPKTGKADKEAKDRNRGKKSNKASDKASSMGKMDTALETDENNIMALLMKMEGQPPAVDQAHAADKPSTSGESVGRKMKSRKATQNRKAAQNKTAKADTSDDSEWEEVEDYKHSPVKSQIPDAPVEITINDPDMIRKKRKKKQFDWKAYLQRRIKRMAREVQVDMHKVHLLCLLTHGLQQNRECSDVTLCASALSVLPSSQLKKEVAFYDEQTLVFFLKWFRSAFCLTDAAAAANKSTRCVVNASQLMEIIQEKAASEPRLLVMVLVAMLRAMGFTVRLVISLQPLPLKTSQAPSIKAASKRKTDANSEAASTSSKKPKQSSATKKQTNASNIQRKSTKSVNVKEKLAKGKAPKQTPSDSKTNLSGSKEPAATESAGKSTRKRKQTSKSKKPSHDTDTSSSEDEDDDDGPSVAKRRASGRSRKSVKPSASAKDDDMVTDDEGVSPEDESDCSNFSEEEEVARKKRKAKDGGKNRKDSGPSVQGTVDLVEGSDEEFDQSFQTKSLVVEEGKARKRANRKVLSDDSDTGEMTRSKGRDYWLEVYLPRPNKWFCVDCIRCEVGKPYDISAAASQPLLYVLGFASDGSVKDITAKYAPQWLSHTRKRRVDSDWWRETLDPYATMNTFLDDQENRDIKDHLVQRPLPTNIGDFKNHPLYALRRHLLKYEAIYPENSIPVGYIRSEPVYARECVHTLHSRDNWLREARLVRLGETAYKMVKSRKRWNRARERSEELDLELFGRWQTEDYIPPPAVNGKVPKNEYGNVELFQPSMLPGGTVHVRVPALNRVARKLGIDIAAAMTGWDHHCGYSHPVLDGWVVCEEHKDALLAAWEEDQAIQRQREEERREKRVLTNWTTLVRGLLIKDKLKKKFNLEEKPAKAEVKKKTKAKKGEKATDVQHAWPAKQQQRQTDNKKQAPAPTHYTVETM